MMNFFEEKTKIITLNYSQQRSLNPTLSVKRYTTVDRNGPSIIN